MISIHRCIGSIVLLAGLSTGQSHASDLSEIYALAAKNDHTFKAAEAQYKLGLEAKKAQRAGLLPSLNGSVSYNDVNATSQVDGQDFVAGQIVNNPLRESESETTGYDLTLSVPLFDLGAWHSYKAGAAQANSAEALYRQQQQNLIIRTAEAYFNTLQAAANLETSLAEEAALKQQLTQSQQRYEVGLNAITEVHEAQASYDSAVADRLSAEGQLGIQFEGLEVLTGQSFSSIAPLSDSFPVAQPAPINRDDWVERAIENNYNLKASQAIAKAAKEQAKAARSGHLPTLTLAAQYSDTDSDSVAGARGFPAFVQSSDDENERITLTLSVPIYNGGSVSSARRQAKQSAIAERENYLQAKRDIVQQTRSEHLNVITGVATVKARKQTIVSRQSALEATEAGYRVGTRDFVDVLNAQRVLFQAKRDYDAALYAYLLSSLRLKDTAGMLSEKDISGLNDWLNSEKSVSNISLTY